jgi:hypothetical protein
MTASSAARRATVRMDGAVVGILFIALLVALHGECLSNYKDAAGILPIGMCMILLRETANTEDQFFNYLFLRERSLNTVTPSALTYRHYPVQYDALYRCFKGPLKY